MIEIYYKTIQETQFQRIEDFRQGSFIYVKNASLSNLKKICEVAGLELSDIRNSLDSFTLPRIEHIGNHSILSLRHPGENKHGQYTKLLTLVITPHFLIAIAPQFSEIIDQLLASNATLETTNPSQLILHILSHITYDYTNHIRQVRYTVLEPSKIVDSNAIISLTQNEEIIDQYLISLVPMRNLLETITHRSDYGYKEEELEFIQDLLLTIRQLEDVCNVNIKSIRNLRESYQIIFTNDVTRTIKILTAITIIFTIPTISASIYGMNVRLPYQDNPYAFWLVMGCTTIAIIASTILFKRKHWL